MLAFRGAIVQTPRIGEVHVLQDKALVVDASGKIARIAAGEQLQELVAQYAVPADAVHILSPQQFLLPGFIDTHVHAPQFPFTGTGTDKPLFEWLDHYTFPTEAAFADPEHARRVYGRLVRRLLALGTTTAAYFTTLHAEACRVLADIVEVQGQRALLGKVSMDQHSPDYYVEDTQAGLEAARQVVEYVAAKRCSRLTPAVIPRFIPTCSQAMLEGLGRLVAQSGAHVHSHIAESRDEVAFVERLHPCVQAGDVGVFRAAGLLTPGSVFAHGTQLGAEGLALMAGAGAAISHCPLSNMFFGDGLLDVAAALRAGVRVGLGSDVAGGYSPSMLVAMRMAVVNSHAMKAAALLQGGADTSVGEAAEQHVLGWQEALWLATVGGADALGLAGVTGALQEGLEFDALLVGVESGGSVDVWEGDSPAQLLEKFLNNGDDRHIRRVYVQGRQTWPGI